MSDAGPMEKMAENGIAIGLIFGVIVGALTDNVGLWLSLGLCLGAAFSSNAKKNEEPVSEDSDCEAEDTE